MNTEWGQGTHVFPFFSPHIHTSLQILFNPYPESEETPGQPTSKFESTKFLLFHIEDCIERQWVLPMLQCLALVCEFVLSWLISEIKKITVNLCKSITLAQATQVKM